MVPIGKSPWPFDVEECDVRVNKAWVLNAIKFYHSSSIIIWKWDLFFLIKQTLTFSEILRSQQYNYMSFDKWMHPPSHFFNQGKEPVGQSDTENLHSHRNLLSTLYCLPIIGTNSIFSIYHNLLMHSPIDGF